MNTRDLLNWLFNQEMERLARKTAPPQPLGVKTIWRTCYACPSQWSGVLENGGEIYIRYRWGYLTCDIDGEPIYGEQHGDGYDGLMSNGDMQNHLANVLDFRRVTWLAEV